VNRTSNFITQIFEETLVIILICAFHTPSLDIDHSLSGLVRVIDRTNVWDAVGVHSYGLVYLHKEHRHLRHG
jgi:hypothetical protein